MGLEQQIRASMESLLELGAGMSALKTHNSDFDSDEIDPMSK